MRQIATSILLVSILFLFSCTPSKKIIDSSTSSTKISELNKKLATQDISIALKNNEVIDPDSSHISSKNLSYFMDGKEETMSLKEVSFIKTSPKLSYSTIIGGPLIIYGGVSSFLYLNGSISSDSFATKSSLPALLGGLGIFVFGNTAETDIYYFE